jgi:hypothetical protein
MLRTTLDALPHHPRASAEEIATLREAAFRAIATLRPRDPLEAMLAARIVGVHAHIMDNLRDAAQPDLPPVLKLRLQGRAVALGRLMDTTLHTFLDRQKTAVARQPAALPVPVPAPRAQPAPAAAQADAPSAPARADTKPQAAPAARPAAAAPTSRQTAPAATPRQANTAATPPAQAGTFTLDEATALRLLQEAAASLGTSLDALAA